MKKLTFKVTSSEKSVVSLIKEVNKISCRIFIDLENGFVTVENVNDSMIDNVIDLVNNYYTILNVDIDNIFEEAAKESVIPAGVETPVEDVEKTPKEEKHEPKVVGPQSEDDLIIRKVKFKNENVENRINNLLKTAYWAMYNKNAGEKDICDFILSTISEISMKFTDKPNIEFSVGDIVDVNFCTNLPGEINGGHVHTIVANILNDDMAYVVPITKQKAEINAKSYLHMEAPKDAIYNDERYNGGTVLLDKGKYVRIERFNFVVGKTNSTFFERLLKQLSRTFDFTNIFVETVEKDENSTAIAAENSAKKEIVDNTIETKETTTKKVGSEETALMETFGFAFDKLNSSISIEGQLVQFLADIGMDTTQKVFNSAFVVACNIKKINYENVISGIKEKFPGTNEKIIEKILKEEFKKWIDTYPALKEKCPKISIISILKVFASKFA